LTELSWNISKLSFSIFFHTAKSGDFFVKPVFYVVYPANNGDSAMYLVILRTTVHELSPICRIHLLV
jgi:uncharacterized RmlC-like cupin family protein